MKFSLKTLAAAVVMAAAATGAQADVYAGTAGNGELFFNIWDANGSYTRGLGSLISNPNATQIGLGYTSSFQGTLDTVGNINLSWAADDKLTSWLATADVASLKWNVVANDTQGANRLLTTYTAPEVAPKQSNVIFSASSAVTTFLSSVNPLMANTIGASLTVNSASAAWAGKAAFKDNIGGLLDFSNAGTLANDSYSSGLGFMRIDAALNNTVLAGYNEYKEGSAAVNVWLDSAKTLHIGAVAAVPEPSEYAMLLAGLGMIGFMARRNKRA